MACTVKELKEALKLLDDEDVIGVDDGGLTLVVVGDPGTFFEIGGIPLDDEDEDGDDPVRCRYSDCEHPVASKDEQVTCPMCRKALGLPPLD